MCTKPPISLVPLFISVVACTPSPSPSPSAPAGGDSGTAACELAPSTQWSGSQPLIAPVSDATHDLVAVKDPTVVSFNGRWHVYASSVSSAGAYNMVYTSFSDWSQASSAPLYYMDQTSGFNTYVAAPQLFYFRPQSRWYLVYQAGPPKYSTANDPGDPTAWTPPAPFFSAEPAIVTQNGGWLDFWVICDAASCYLFFSDNHGRWYRSKTSIDQFPNGFGEPVVALEDANAGRIFEASNVYAMNGTNQYLAIIEAFDQTSNNRRYFRSWIADSLEGPWLPWQASGSFPFAGARNVSFEGAPWTNDISHGEAIRAGYDETLAIEPCRLRYVFQGADPTADNGGDYNKIPWRLGLLTQTSDSGP
jgi:endo-1,4-beta-xylanase